MKTGPAPLPAILLGVLCLHGIAYATAALEITHPRVREAPPSARVLAAYMSIRNPGDSAITINGISSPDFESAEVHRTVINDGAAGMLHVKQLDVPANGIVRLEPGGLHLMLFNPKRILAEGDTIILTILLGNETRMTVSAPVVRQDAGDHSQHRH